MIALVIFKDDLEMIVNVPEVPFEYEDSDSLCYEMMEEFVTARPDRMVNVNVKRDRYTDKLYPVYREID